MIRQQFWNEELRQALGDIGEPLLKIIPGLVVLAWFCSLIAYMLLLCIHQPEAQLVPVGLLF